MYLMTQDFGPYKQGQQVTNRRGTEGAMFLDPKRFAQWVAEGVITEAEQAESSEAEEPALEPASKKRKRSSRNG